MSLESLNLDGKNALVTGAGRGMGRGMAIALAKAGANVAVVSRSQDDLNEVARAIETAGRRALPVTADVGDVESIRAMVGTVAEAFDKHIDILVTAAGIIVRNQAADYTPEEWDRLMAINLKGRFFTCQAVGRIMLAQGQGSIINIGSLTSGIGLPGVAVYAVANGGIAQMTRTLSAEWCPKGVRVNCIAPGTFVTRTTAAILSDAEKAEVRLRRIPQGRFGDPEKDLDGAVVFLASDSSSYVTGQILYVDGGAISAY